MKVIRTILQWRQDSHDLRLVFQARQISRQGALNTLAYIMRERAMR